MSQQFTFVDNQQVEHMVEWAQPGITVVMDSLGLMTQLIPASALPYFNGTVIAGHDVSFQVSALQADGTTPFNLTGVPVNFYGKVNQPDTVLVFTKTFASNPTDILIPTPANGLITVFVRAADYASVAVGTTIFLYVDVVNSIGNPVNIAKWTLTITN
jgi:hypothetical protein